MRRARAQKYANLPNRVRGVLRIKWTRGTITIRTITDKYPAGNKSTYSMSVSRRGRVIGQTKSGKDVRERTEIIEANTFAPAHYDSMMARVEYFQSLPKEMTVE